MKALVHGRTVPNTPKLCSLGAVKDADGKERICGGSSSASGSDVCPGNSYCRMGDGNTMGICCKQCEYSRSSNNLLIFVCPENVVCFYTCCILATFGLPHEIVVLNPQSVIHISSRF